MCVFYFTYVTLLHTTLKLTSIPSMRHKENQFFEYPAADTQLARPWHITEYHGGLAAVQ